MYLLMDLCGWLEVNFEYSIMGALITVPMQDNRNKLNLFQNRSYESLI